MSERMSVASNKAGFSSSGNELLMTFSASKEEELKVMLNCLPPDRRLMMDSWIRVFVKDQILLAHENPLACMDRNIDDERCNSKSRSLELRFTSNICSLLLTGEKIKGEDCECLQVALFDSLTGEEVKSGPQSSAKVQIVVLEGDSDRDGGDFWTHEEFDKRVVREVKGKKSLLVGNVRLNLIKGTGCVPEISFTSNSGWMKNSRFRLGARVVDYSNGICVREAITNLFELKDWRGELYRSHNTPSLCGEVWRLHKIGKKGPVNKRLGMENIKTVKDFLDLHFTNTQKLQEIFSGNAKNLEIAVSHARTCPDKLMYYPSGLERKTGVVFNVSGEVQGLIMGHQFASSNMLSETEKDRAYTLVICAFRHWGDVIPFDDQKYLGRCSEADLWDEVLRDDLLELNDSFPYPPNQELDPPTFDDILVLNDSFSYSPDQGLDTPTFESMLQNIDEIFSSIDAQNSNVNPHPHQQHADIAFSVNCRIPPFASDERSLTCSNYRVPSIASDQESPIGSNSRVPPLVTDQGSPTGFNCRVLPLVCYQESPAGSNCRTSMLIDDHTQPSSSSPIVTPSLKPCGSTNNLDNIWPVLDDNVDRSFEALIGDHAQSSNSSLVVTPSLNPGGSTNNLDNILLGFDDSIDRSFLPCQTHNKPIPSTEDISKYCQELCQSLYSDHIRPEIPNGEMHPEQQGSTSDILLVASQAVCIDRTQKRWPQVAKLLRRLSIRRRIGAMEPEGVHIQKKQRCC